MNLITVPFSRDSGHRMAFAKAVASRSGRMDRSMKVTGQATWPMTRAALSTLMVIFMRANGLTTKLTDAEHISI